MCQNKTKQDSIIVCSFLLLLLLLLLLFLLTFVTRHLVGVVVILCTCCWCTCTAIYVYMHMLLHNLVMLFFSTHIVQRARDGV